MSSIFGLAWLDGRPCPPEAAERMARVASAWGPDGVATWRDGSAMLGRSLMARTPEDKFDAQPQIDSTAGVAVTAAGRLDNRDDLLADLDASPHDTADATLIARAYARWQEEAPRRLLGDWAFAAWHPRSRRLVLARDQLGCTGLYYWHRAPLIAFASDLSVLLALPDVARRVDEEWLLRYLTISSLAALDRTLYEGVRSLPPAQRLIVDEHGATSRAYWSARETRMLPRASHRDYIEGFLAHYRRAVRVRLRSSAPIASMLSSGLDSGSVTSLAAEALREQGQPLTAFTAVPRGPVDADRPASDNEWAVAAETAARWDNVTHVGVDAYEISPMASLERSVSAFPLPVHGAVNLHWYFGIIEGARARGHRVLLCGQLGNFTVSWNGGARRLAYLLRHAPLSRGWPALAEWRAGADVSWFAALRRHVLGPLLGPPLSRVRTLLPPYRPVWHSWAAPNLRFVERYARDGRPEAWNGVVLRSALHPLEERAQLIEMAGTTVGPISQAAAAASGLDMRDPTGDVRLAEYCWGLPDTCHSRDGNQRMLLKDGLSGLMPAGVLHHPRRARQGADIVRRLNASVAEVDATIDRLAASVTASNYLDFEEIRAAFTDLHQGLAKAPDAARNKVMRGLLAAACLSRLSGDTL
jgi:asparagine synthase (glutamine-hydrolysing)